MLTLLDILPGEFKQRGDVHYGPCPSCGGKDRCVVDEKTGTWLYWCRRCHEAGRDAGGDVVHYLRTHRQMEYREACEYVGQDPGEYEAPQAAIRTATRSAKQAREDRKLLSVTRRWQRILRARQAATDDEARVMRYMMQGTDRMNREQRRFWIEQVRRMEDRILEREEA